MNQSQRECLRHPSIAVSMVFLLLATLALPSAAQPADPIAEELRNIHRALDRLATALQGDAEHRRATLLLQRAQLEAVGLAPLEAELRRAREDAENIRQQFAPAETALEDVERRLFDAETEERQRQLGAEREHVRVMLDNIEQQAQSKDGHVAELEGDLRQRRALFDTITAEIDRLLGIQ